MSENSHESPESILVLRIVDAIHRDKIIEKEVVFQAIEQALITAASARETGTFLLMGRMALREWRVELKQIKHNG